MVRSGKVNSLSGLVVTRLDVLSGFEKVQVATKYRLNGDLIRHVPQDTHKFAKVEPVYEAMPGWDGGICLPTGIEKSRRLNNYLIIRLYFHFRSAFSWRHARCSTVV